ncbi:restriction endonuclease subunit S [Fusobacterium sp. SYSU M8A802]
MDASFNEKLENIEWGEYRLCELFEIQGTRSLDSNAVTFIKKGINFIGRTNEFNGKQGEIELQEFEPNEPYTITATVIGNYKYVKLQKEPYYCSQNINKLTPKLVLKNNWNEYTINFLITYIQKFVSLYNGQQGGYKLEDIKNHIIQLPTKEGKIDFEFMESFVAELEAQRIAELEAYLTVTGLKNYQLTKEEKLALKELDTIEWKEYKIVELYDVKNTKNILSSEIEFNSGLTPYLCASAENNSIASYIKYKDNFLDKGNCVFIGGKTFVVSYQANDFYSNDSHNLALYLKNREKLTVKNQLFMISCIVKGLSHKYNWGNSISNKKIQKDLFQLPIKNGEINFKYMEILISAIQKLVIKDVVVYAEKKIKATKEVINR